MLAVLDLRSTIKLQLEPWEYSQEITTCRNFVVLFAHHHHQLRAILKGIPRTSHLRPPSPFPKSQPPYQRHTTYTLTTIPPSIKSLNQFYMINTNPQINPSLYQPRNPFLLSSLPHHFLPSRPFLPFFLVPLSLPPSLPLSFPFIISLNLLITHLPPPNTTLYSHTPPSVSSSSSSS